MGVVERSKWAVFRRFFQRLHKRTHRIKSADCNDPKLRKLRERGLPGVDMGIPGQRWMVVMVEALRGCPRMGETGETRGKQGKGVKSERMIWRAPIWALKRPKQAQTHADLGAKKSAQNGSVLMEK